MPEINMRGVKVDDIITISKALVDDLVKATGSPREWFRIEVFSTTCISDGKIVPARCMVEVEWVMRTKDKQDAVADVISEHLNKAGYDPVDVKFTVLDRKYYYSNGFNDYRTDKPSTHPPV